MKMYFDNVHVWLAVVISACVVLASAYLCYLSPDHSWRYLLAILVVYVAWMVRHLYRGDREAGAGSLAARRKVTQAIVSSGLLLVVAQAGAIAARFQ